MLGAKRAISAAQFASSEAGRHQQVRLARASCLRFQNQQKRKDLNGLAEPHVIGETRPQPRAG